jgi:hypothetical protein
MSKLKLPATSASSCPRALQPPKEHSSAGRDFRIRAGRIDGARHGSKRFGEIVDLFGRDAAQFWLRRLVSSDVRI